MTTCTMNYNKFNQLSVFGHSVYLLEAKVVQIRMYGCGYFGCDN